MATALSHGAYGHFPPLEEVQAYPTRGKFQMTGYSRSTKPRGITPMDK
jgi:hypothetical protein